MYELEIKVSKVRGKCTADPPMKVGDSFTVRDGNIWIPEGGFICLYALQSLMPLITPKEREIVEEKSADWMWRVHHAQCPDPKGRVLFEISQTAKIGQDDMDSVDDDLLPGGRSLLDEVNPADGNLHNLRVIVESVRGKCTSGMKPGDYFILRSGRLMIPPNQHFCLYALQAVVPLLPAKQRPLMEGDWLKEDSHVICPDPAGNVIMRIEPWP